jgi:tRNA A37 threonylcarbamoyltransferase TsaD
LPYVVKGMDLSFSGLLTAAISELNSGKYNLKDLCYSIQETAYAMLGEVTERALAHTGKHELLITGGVGANKRLRNIIQEIADEHDVNPKFVPIRFATDNGTMVAWTGILAYLSGVKTEILTSFVDPKWRMDQVDIPWRN